MTRRETIRRLRQLEQAYAAKDQPPIVVITGTDEEHDTKVAEAHASGLANEEQILVYIRKFSCA